VIRRLADGIRTAELFSALPFRAPRMKLFFSARMTSKYEISLCSVSMHQSATEPWWAQNMPIAPNPFSEWRFLVVVFKRTARKIPNSENQKRKKICE